MPLPDIAFDPTLTIIPQKSYARFYAESSAQLAAGATADNIFTLANHTLINGQLIEIEKLTGLSGVTNGLVYIIGADEGEFQIALTKGGSAIVLGSDGSAKITPIVDMVGKAANYEQSMETVKRKVPDAKGVLRTDREVLTGQEEDFKFEIEELKWLGKIFDGFAGLEQGRVQLIITDPDDETDKAAIITNTFKCSAKVDGGVNFKAGEFSKATIMFSAYEEVTVEYDGDL
jgi:hypothetical protein